MLLLIAPVLVSFKFTTVNINRDNLPLISFPGSHSQTAVQRVIHDATCVRGRESETLFSRNTEESL